MSDSIITLLGDERPPPPIGEDVRARLEAALAAAEAEAESQPDDPEALIWLGRRLAYLGRYREAVAAFDRGIERWPEDARFYRHRGHRHLTLRRFADAQADFETAARLIAGRPDEPEPDGIRAARAEPSSTLHFNVWYHLGLVRYLGGDLTGAADAYRACAAVSETDDKLVATSYWRWLTSTRNGDMTTAATVLQSIRPEMDVRDNTPYHRLLLLFRGLLTPEELVAEPAGGSSAAMNDSTLGYGIGAWHLIGGRDDEAVGWFERVYAGPQWAAFGFIAAETELAARRSAGQP